MTDPTPLTPFTVRDHLIAALTALKGTPAADLAQIAAQLVTLQGTPAEDLHTLAEGLYTQTNPRNPYLVSVISRLEGLQEQVDKIQAVLGAEPYSSTETGNIRALLMSIYSLLRQQSYGLPPSSAVDTFLSTGELATGGRRYAVFGDIAGVTESDGGRTLTADWSDWEAYIQTTDPAPQIAGASDVPNMWVSLVGSGEIDFSVAAQYTISVFLRAPASYGDAIILYSTALSDGVLRQYAVWPSGEPFNAISYLGELTLAPFDLAGWKFKVDGIASGTHIMKYSVPGNAAQSDYQCYLGSWIEWVTPTDLIYFIKNDGLSDPFTVTLIPPGFPIPS